MSMQSVEYQGYGVDLGEFEPKNLWQEQVIEYMSEHLDELFDNIDDPTIKELEFAQPINTDSFEGLVIIPAVIPIMQSSDQPIKIYNEKTAKLTLIRALRLFANETLDMMDDFDYSDEEFSDLIEALIDFVNENADFSYNHDWTDLV